MSGCGGPCSYGPPLHVHAASDETFLVLSGVLLVGADGQVATTPEGGLVHVSGGMPHTFATTPDSPACFFVLHTPSGSGEFHSVGGEDQFIVEPGDIASCSFPVAVDLQVGG